MTNTQEQPCIVSTDEDMALDTMNVPVAVLPDQFFREPQREWNGVHRLAYAVLSDAYFVYRQGQGSHRISQQDRTEVIRWFFTDKKTNWPFSFVNICHLLGLSPDYLRRGLKLADLHR